MMEAAEDSPVAIAGCMEDDWATRLPRIPVAKQEAKDSIRRQILRDKLSVVRLLALLGPVFAGVAARLGLTRGTACEVLDLLKGTELRRLL